MSFLGCHIFAQHSANTDKRFIVFIFYDNPSVSFLDTSLYTREALFLFTLIIIFQNALCQLFSILHCVPSCFIS